ncbi:ParB N-terminal domain-containing protein [Oscillochloris sp. ZM17-4]|uniref:methyltransferase domain-containing protein n=1 Tax=Oscillochloris sp. ZM17-4 TaxID=2866714 RepID=UPI001C72C80E|nr:ParB N-terminal domain-containing protein [Oscillochloris sp. ZM17-4]MBX0328669.1 ParB N-terminal domain-containing protein [Oscillochloris sp. ZM17-4]
MPFYLEYPVENLRPAPYNPRKIDDTAFGDLCRSITQIGMAKPIIVNDDGTIVAGHQRLKALKATGGTVTPVYIVTGLTASDEMRFNQLHNGTDMDTGDEHVLVPAMPGSLGYFDVEPDSVQANMRSAGAPIRSEIAKLLIGYGPWGGIVATQSGECLSGAQYAITCKSLGYPVRTFYVRDADAPIIRGLFQRQYGQFFYEHLARETYIQTFAQPFRCRTDAAGNTEGVKSPTWEKRVLPEYQVGEHILDFGCGQADYVKKITRELPHIPIWGMEFFYRKGDYIDSKAVHRMADELFHHLETQGLFDVVVCDYVLNSIDSQRAEDAVLTCLNAFARPGGRIYASGRRRDFIEQNIYATSHRGAMRGFEFLDSAGLSGILFKGRWFYQKFHTKAQALDAGRRFLDPEVSYQNHSATQFNLRVGAKAQELPIATVEAALRFEFDLPWPGGQRVNRAEDAVRAWRKAIEISGRGATVNQVELAPESHTNQ